MTCILLFAAVTAYMGCLSTALAEKLKKIDGFENLSLKIDGFGRTHANDATEEVSRSTATFHFFTRSLL